MDLLVYEFSVVLEDLLNHPLARSEQGTQPEPAAATSVSLSLSWSLPAEWNPNTLRSRY